MESEIVWLDSISDSITIIPLETSDEILMFGGGSYHLYNNLLFIVHRGLGNSHRLSVFDLSGKYLRDIGRHGQGPGEYISISRVNGVFFNNDKVYIHDWMSCAILCYTLSGKFIKKIRYPKHHFFEVFTFIDKDVIAGFAGLDGIFRNSRIFFMNEDGKYIDSVSHYKRIDKQDIGISSENEFFFNYNGKKYLKESYYDTVFQVKKDLKLYPEYIIDAGKYAITFDDVLERGDKFQKGKRITVKFENDKYIVVKEYPFTIEKLSYIFIEKGSATAKRVCFYYSEETCRHFLKEKVYLNPDNQINTPGVFLEPPKRQLINDGSPTLRTFNVSEDNMIWIGSEMALDRNDNPVIVLIHIKH